MTARSRCHAGAPKLRCLGVFPEATLPRRGIRRLPSHCARPRGSDRRASRLSVADPRTSPGMQEMPGGGSALEPEKEAFRSSSDAASFRQSTSSSSGPYWSQIRVTWLNAPSPPSPEDGIGKSRQRRTGGPPRSPSEPARRLPQGHRRRLRGRSCRPRTPLQTAAEPFHHRHAERRASAPGRQSGRAESERPGGHRHGRRTTRTEPPACPYRCRTLSSRPS